MKGLSMNENTPKTAQVKYRMTVDCEQNRVKPVRHERGEWVKSCDSAARLAALEAQVQKLRFTPRELEVLEREIEGAVANCQGELAPIFKSILEKLRAALQPKDKDES